MTAALRQALRAMREPEIQIEVRIDVDSSGKIAGVLSTNRGDALRNLLSGIAEDTARHWRFEPALRNGQPVSGVAVVPFRFVRSTR
jgi:outer membrane biosynthesis protein TonB